MSDMQVRAVSGNNTELTTTPQIDPNISNEPISKRRSATSPAALELNSLPLPKGKKSPVRERFSGKCFESGEWTVSRSGNSGQPIKASFTPGSEKFAGSLPKSIPIDTENMIDEALRSLQDIEKKHSV